MKVVILGEKYEVIEDKDILKEDAHGICDRYKKEIRIVPKDLLYVESDDEKAKESRYREVLRHEIIHAFMFEAGLDEYSNDELIVQWIASMYPKLKNSFDSVDCG